MSESTPHTLPSVFVGSSTEGLACARAVRSQLADAAVLVLWNEGFFALGRTFIETLVNELPRFDFAILILTADALISERDAAVLGPRDNLIFELGLFTAGLGRSRTFVIKESRIKMPTDLAGVTMAEYRSPTHSGDLMAVLGPACDSIRTAIESLGPADTKTAQRITQLQTRQTDVEAAIRTLRFVVRGIVTNWEAEKLEGLSRPTPFIVRFSRQMVSELARLRALGYVRVTPGHTITSLHERDGNSDEFDLKQYFDITQPGLEYLRLREESSPEST